MRRQILQAAILFVLAGLAGAAQAQDVLKVLGEQGTAPAQAAPVNPYAAGTPEQAPMAPIQTIAPDDRPLWQAIADGNWALFDDLATARTQAESGWAPSAAMLAARQDGARADALQKLIASGNARALVAAAATDPKSFDCAHAGNLWALADAHLTLDNKASAMAIYSEAAATCKSTERYAAIEKYRALASLEETLALIDTPGIAKHPSETAARAEIAQAIEDMKPKPAKADPMGQMQAKLAKALDAAKPGAAIPAIAAEAGDKADARKSSKTADMLGWLYHKSGREDEAVAWFRKAVEWGGKKDSKSGLIYALAATGEAGRAEARELAAKWPDTVPPSMFAGDAKVEALANAQKSKDWAQCLTLANGAKDPASIVIGAWCKHESGDSKGALAAFKSVALADKTPDGIRQDANKGWVIAARAAKDSAALKELTDRGILDAGEQKTLAREIGIARFWDAYEKQQYSTALNIIKGLASSGVEVTDQEALIGGWSAYQAGQCSRAYSIFASLIKSKDPEVRKGASGGFRAVQGSYRAEAEGKGACGRDKSAKSPVEKSPQGLY